MKKDHHSPGLFEHYGPEIKSGNRATNGGHIEPKPLKYHPPVGPLHQNHEKPGLGGGTAHGNRGTQGKH